MRQLLSCAVAGLVLAVTACGTDGDAPAASARHGEFRVLLPGRPTTFNPNISLDEAAYVIGRNVFSQLLALNETGRILPELAADWHVSPDGRTYTFTLPPDVRWHDGAPLTSADVKWTLESIQRDGIAKDALAPVARIETPDRLTVVVTLAYSWAPFAAELAGFGMSILPRHLYDGHDWRTHAANQAPVGTGPFRFDRWADDHTVVLTANPRYFRGGPFVERVVFSAPGQVAADARLLAGDADLSVVRPAAIDVRKPLPAALAFRTLPSSGRIYMAMNLRRRPLDDVRVRRALAAAVDRLEIISDAMDGMGAPAVGWYTPDVEWAYNAAARVPPFDAARARQLLDAAGLRPGPAGTRLRLRLATGQTSPYEEIASVLKAQFRRIGVELTIEALPFTEFPRRVVQEHDFDLAIVSGSQGPDPDELRQRFSARTATGAYIGYADAAFEAAVDRGARTIDVAARAAAYYRAQELLARDLPFIPLAENVKLIVFHRRISGLPQFEARGLVGVFDYSLVRVAADAANPGAPR